MTKLICAWCLLSAQDAVNPLLICDSEGEVIKPVTPGQEYLRRGYDMPRLVGLGRTFKFPHGLVSDALAVTMYNGTALCVAHLDEVARITVARPTYVPAPWS